MASFTHYWQNDTWDAERDSGSGDVLEHTAGNEFRARGVEPGDFIYVVTVKAGKLYVLGRFQVADILPKSEAERRLGQRLWGADEHCLAVSGTGTVQDYDRRVPDRITSRLRFLTDNDEKSPVFSSPGVLDQQTMRGVRRLTPESAALLDDLVVQGARSGRPPFVLNVEEAWSVIRGNAERVMRAAEVFTSPKQERRYKVIEVMPSRITVERLDADAVETLTEGEVYRSVAAINDAGGRVRRRSLLYTVAKETPLVHLHPGLRWSPDHDYIESHRLEQGAETSGGNGGDADGVEPPTAESLRFEVGRVYNRREDIHALHGGQMQGGISTPSGPFIFLFTGESGEQYGYKDGLDSNGVFLYTGEGQVGDMQFIRGNRAIRDHAADGKELHLFQALGKGKGYRYLGRFDCATWEHRDGIDREGTARKVIVFHLVQPDKLDETNAPQSPAAPRSSLEDLRRRAYEAAAPAGQRPPTLAKRTYYERSADVRRYVLARAAGTCEACGRPAPFSRADGEPYLEPHHLRRVADGGPDHPRWVAGICPNCHREAHHGKERDDLNRHLEEHLGAAERQDVDGNRKGKA